MKSPLNDKNDIKIFILYLLENINYPLDFKTVNDIVVQNDFVGYFDFAECFAELLDAGHIIEEEIDGTPYYSISQIGSHVASQLQSSILSSIREKSLKSAMRLLSFKKCGAKLSCEAEAHADGKYSLHCKITEKERDLLDLTVSVDSLQRIEKMKATFDERPEVVYRGVLALLSGDVDYLLAP